MGGMPNIAQEGERPITVLKRQRPLPKATPTEELTKELMEKIQ